MSSYPFYKGKLELALQILKEQLEKFTDEIEKTEYVSEHGGYDAEIESIRTQEIPHLLYIIDRFSKSLERIN